MTELHLPLATTTWDESERRAVLEVLDGGRFTMGPRVADFERALARAVGAEHAVMVNSGSSANLLAVAALVLDERIDLSPGDEVLVPAVSWATTYYPLHQYGLRMRFVDIDLDTLNMDVEAAARAITPRTRAIMAVNLLGNPNRFDALLELARQHGLVVIEDNCEALGARFQGRATGTFGMAGTFSFFFSHHISTMEGGAICTDDETTAQILTSLRAHGWTRELPAVNRVFDKSGDEFEDLFRFILPGYNVRPLEMSGAIGLEQLRKLPQIVASRRDNAQAYREVFADVAEVRVQAELGESSWFGFSLVLEGRLAGRRREVVQALRDHGVECRPIVAGNFTRNPVIRHLNVEPIGPLPAADKVHDDGLFVGNHHYPVLEGLTRARDALMTVR